MPSQDNAVEIILIMHTSKVQTRGLRKQMDIGD
jgi:hypothetical protein